MGENITFVDKLDVVESTNFFRIILPDHTLMIIRSIVNKRLTDVVIVQLIHDGFRQKRGPTDTIFMLIWSGEKRGMSEYARPCILRPLHDIEHNTQKKRDDDYKDRSEKIVRASRTVHL